MKLNIGENSEHTSFWSPWGTGGRITPGTREVSRHKQGKYHTKYNLEVSRQRPRERKKNYHTKYKRGKYHHARDKESKRGEYHAKEKRGISQSTRKYLTKYRREEVSRQG